MKTHSILLVATLTVAGCAAAPYTLVPVERQVVGGGLSIEPGSAWNRVNHVLYEGKLDVWTLDGMTLNSLMFFHGVADGEPILKPRRVLAGGADKEEKPPVFRSAMTPLEIQELFEDTLARIYQTPIVEARHLKPATLAGEGAFRFETRVVGRDEVERQGTAVGAVRGGKLYLLWFQGAKLHYYDRYLPEFERIVASARFVAP